MKISWFFQLLIIIGFLLLGYGISTIFRIPLPGSVIGMILLFVFLLTGLLKIEWIEKISSFQLKHLTLLFIPPIVSLFLSSTFLHMMDWSVILILMISSVCCLLGSAFAVEWYEKRKGSHTE